MISISHFMLKFVNYILKSMLYKLSIFLTCLLFNIATSTYFVTILKILLTIYGYSNDD